MAENEWLLKLFLGTTYSQGHILNIPDAKERAFSQKRREEIIERGKNAPKLYTVASITEWDKLTLFHLYAAEQLSDYNNLNDKIIARVFVRDCETQNFFDDISNSLQLSEKELDSAKRKINEKLILDLKNYNIYGGEDSCMSSKLSDSF